MKAKKKTKQVDLTLKEEEIYKDIMSEKWLM